MKRYMKFGKPYSICVRPSFKRKYRFRVVVLLVVLSLIYCIWSAVIGIRPVIEDVSEKLLNAHGTNIINRSILESIGDENIYDSVMKINRDGLGKITSIEADAKNINTLKANLSVDILNGIDQFGSRGFTVPLGNLTDIILLSGIGPKIPFRIVPYGSVKTDFRSEFTSVGINQTRHEVYIDVTADLHAISAVAQIRSSVSTSVMVGQTVIVGEVPKFFSGGEN